MATTLTDRISQLAGVAMRRGQATATFDADTWLALLCAVASAEADEREDDEVEITLLFDLDDEEDA